MESQSLQQVVRWLDFAIIPAVLFTNVALVQQSDVEDVATLEISVSESPQ